MTERPVFVTFDKAPFYKIAHVNFEWHSGMAVSQKQKNIRELHSEFKETYDIQNVLEISSKSMQEHGTELSAFNLDKYVESLDARIPVERIYQSSKVFELGGPYTELMMMSSPEAKKDGRLKESGKMVGYRFEGRDYPIVPARAFYDYIYMNALLEHEELAETVLKYDAFTDIEFNPKKGINCQARAAAVFVSMKRLGLEDRIRDFDDYVKIIRPTWEIEGQAR